MPVTFAWYAGFGVVIYVPWIINTLIGAIFGQLIGDPKAIGLDVLLPIYFLGLVMSFRTREPFSADRGRERRRLVAAVHFVGSPWHVSIGALAGIVLAACMPPKRPAIEAHAVEKEGLILGRATPRSVYLMLPPQSPLMSRASWHVLITQLKYIPPRSNLR